MDEGLPKFFYNNFIQPPKESFIINQLLINIEMNETEKKNKELLEEVEKGHLSIGKAAELLKIPIQDIYELAKKHSIRLGATLEQIKESEKTLKMLLKKK